MEIANRSLSVGCESAGVSEHLIRRRDECACVPLPPRHGIPAMLLIFLLAISACRNSDHSDTERTMPPANSSALGDLPEPRSRGEQSLEATLATRRSVRDFAGEPLTDAEISQLLWAAQGITDSTGLRTAPSAGALYPLELYLATASGLYRYASSMHQLSRRSERDLRSALQAAALGQEAVGDAPAVFVITAVSARTRDKYGARAQRYVHMEAGHAAQNLLLQATALDLGGVPVGAFDDKRLSEVLELAVNEDPLYLIPVGRPSHVR